MFALCKVSNNAREFVEVINKFWFMQCLFKNKLTGKISKNGSIQEPSCAKSCPSGHFSGVSIMFLDSIGTEPLHRQKVNITRKKIVKNSFILFNGS